jgi:RecB family exonuclease
MRIIFRHDRKEIRIRKSRTHEKSAEVSLSDSSVTLTPFIDRADDRASGEHQKV